MKRITEAFKNNEKLVGLFIIPIPILIYWTYWMLNPSYWFNADPGALYFVDSLSIFIGQTYGYVDHPGIPMQVLGSLMLAVTYPFFGGTEAFTYFFLSRPGAFFLMTNVFLLVINLTCAIIFYKTIASTLTQNPILAAIATSLLSFTLHPHSYPSLTFWSHNSLNYPIGTLLLIWLYRELRNSKDLKPSKLFILGLANGIFAMAQMYFFAWLVSGVITVFIFSMRLNKNIRQAIQTGLYMAFGGIVGVAAMLIPMYKALPRFINWLAGLVTHLGLYGSGERGVYSLSLIPLSMQYWWANIRIMVILLMLAIVILIVFAYWSRNTNSKLPAGDFAMLTGLLIHVGLLLLLMTKAALKLRYSLSLAAVLPVLVFMILKLLETTDWKVKLPLQVFYVLAIAGVFVSLIGQKSEIDQRAYVEADAQRAKTEAINNLSRELNVGEEQVVVVYAYSVPLKCAGLLQATNWTGNFKDELARICPNQFAIWDSTIELNTAVPVRKIEDIDWDLVIWPGNGTDLPDYLYSIGATNPPGSWAVRRSKWFFIHSEILNQ